MRVLVCGGREYGDLASLRNNRTDPHWLQREREYKHVQRTLDTMSLEWPQTEPDEYGNTLPVVTIISGGAPGADTAGSDWAVVNWTDLQEFTADWKRFGPAAGPIRNQRMIDEGRPDLVVVFPGGTGTADMMRRARAAGIEVREVSSALRPDLTGGADGSRLL